MNMIKQLSILLFAAYLFQSCVFSSDKEYFVEIDPTPKNTSIENFLLDMKKDTIYLWKSTRFEFDLISEVLGIKDVKIRYADKELLFHEYEGAFYISPNDLPDGSYSLEMEVLTPSGTRSLADIRGKETMIFKKKWVLVIEKPKVPEINIKSEIENGFLKFSWNKIEEPYIKKISVLASNYGLRYYYSYGEDYTNKNSTSYIDSLFVGGEIRFRVIVDYYDENGSERNIYKDYFYEFPISLHFKEDLDQLTIFWHSPFQCTPQFVVEYNEFIRTSTDTTHILPPPGLGYPKQYQIRFKPLKEIEEAHVVSGNFTLGDNMLPSYETILFDKEHDRYFIKDPMYINAFNFAFEKLGSYNYSYDYHDDSSIDLSMNGQSLFSIVHGENIQLKSIGLEKISSTDLKFDDYTRSFKNLNDTIFIIGMNRRFIFFNRITGIQIDTTEPIKTGKQYQSYNYSISKDNRYLAYADFGGLYIYENKNNTEFILRYVDEKDYYSCFFNPIEPHKLILNGEVELSIFDCSLMLTEKIIPSFSANPINIDPLTHYMLLVSNRQKKIFIYDYENEIKKMEMTHHGSAWDFRLFNNKLFTKSGYIFDISSYVN